MARGFIYLAAVMDWFSRRVLSWRVSITMEATFCVEALEEALARHGNPQIFNTDQGSQFTCHSFTDVLVEHQIAISMDGRSSWRDNVFLERFWRSVKYEEVYLPRSLSFARLRLMPFGGAGGRSSDERRLRV
jgi:putative transposase